MVTSRAAHEACQRGGGGGGGPSLQREALRRRTIPGAALSLDWVAGRARAAPKAPVPRPTAARAAPLHPGAHGGLPCCEGDRQEPIEAHIVRHAVRSARGLGAPRPTAAASRIGVMKRAPASILSVLATRIQVYRKAGLCVYTWTAAWKRGERGPCRKRSWWRGMSGVTGRAKSGGPRAAAAGTPAKFR